MMTNKRQSYILIGLALVLLVLAAGLVAGKDNNKKASNVKTPAAASQTAPVSNLPREDVSLTIQHDAITEGPTTITAAPGQEIKITVQGLGYGEGDNMIIKGYSQSFFELDELDGPTTQYVTITKPGTYPLIIQTTNKQVGQIVIK